MNIGALFNPLMGAREACERFWSKRPIVRLRDAVHIVGVGPTGSGKGTSLIIPWLLSCDESCVTPDFKGENARLTMEQRRRMGQQIALLDPYRVVTQKPDTFNPLDFIDRDCPQAIDECNDLAEAMVVRTGKEQEPHWNDSAEAYIAAVIAVTVAYGEKDKGTRSLQTVREILSNPARLETATKLMASSDRWDGLLAQMGGQLMHFADKEKSSVLSSAMRHLRFLGTVPVAESTQRSSFDPAMLRRGRMTVYLILPPEHMRAQAGLLRMWVSSMIRACVRGGLQ